MSNRAFHRFEHAKPANIGLVLGSSQFLLQPQVTQKMALISSVVKIDLKIIILLSKSVTHSVAYEKI